MPRFLLDTNIVSYSFRRTHSALNERIAMTAKTGLCISCVTEAELLYGAALLPPEARIHEALRAFFPSMAVLPWTSSCARAYGPLCASLQMSGRPLSALDTMIAAHALALNLVLVTNDQAFARISSLTVQDWTKGPLPA